MAYLVLVRHGKSEWNKTGQWTGHTDISLAPEGIEEARRAAEVLKDIPIQCAHISKLKRAHETFTEICGVLNSSLEPEASSALNERDYGIYTGKNKWEVKEQLGEEAFKRLRRSWDEPVPEGESLKDVYARVVPYYVQHVLPQLRAGKNTLIVAHGNSLRALIKYLEDIPADTISEVEIGTGEVWCYSIGEDGTVHGKEVRAVNENRGKV